MQKLTEDDIIATLSHSKLPTVLTEGRTDYTVFQQIERNLSDLKVSFLPIGGKQKVLNIFNRRAEHGRTDILYIVDKDLWLYTNPPAQYESNSIITTDGYSIENDVIRDGPILSLMSALERSAFFAELGDLTTWFAIQIDRHFKNQDVELKTHSNEILACKLYEQGLDDCDPDLLDGFANYSDEDSLKYVRGKNIFDLALRQLSKKGRISKYSRENLYEIGGVSGTPYLERLETLVRQELT